MLVLRNKKAAHKQLDLVQKEAIYLLVRGRGDISSYIFSL